MSRGTHKKMKSRVSLGKLIRVCPGGRQAWYESIVGPVRKPYTPTAR